MAGDWIPMRLDLYEDPAVISMASELEVREELVVGYLHKIWSWTSRHCHDGTVTGVTLESLGRATNLPGFPELMRQAGWLEEIDLDGIASIRFPKFDLWLAESAKKRLKDAQRQRRKRKNDVTEMSRCERDKSVTTEQERTESTKGASTDVDDARASLKEPESLSKNPEAQSIAPQRKKAQISQNGKFEQFWEVVHRKTGKRKAREAFKKAVAHKRSETSLTADEAADAIIASMTEYRDTDDANPTDRSPIHPTTWLNQGRYDDDPDTWHSSRNGRKDIFDYTGDQ